MPRCRVRARSVSPSSRSAFADRRVYPAAADGRHRRPAVPRVCDLRVDHHRDLGDGLVDADADDGRAVPHCRSASARALLQRGRAGVRWHGRILRADAGRRAAVPIHHAHSLPGDGQSDRACCMSSSRRGSSRHRTPASSSASRRRRRTPPTHRWQLANSRSISWCCTIPP